VRDRQRVLIVGPTPPPVGGMSSVTAECIAAVRESSRFEPVNIEIKHKGRRQVGALNPTNLAIGWRLLRQLRRELANPRNALCHLHASVSTRLTVIKNLAIAQTVKRTKTPLLLHPHSGAIEQLLLKHPQGWRMGMDQLMAMADGVVVMSPRWHDLFSHHWPQIKLHQLITGVDTELYSHVAGQRPSAAERPIRVLFMGHLTPYKGLAELLTAWRLLMLEGLPCELDLLGEARDAAGKSLGAQLAALPNVNAYGLVTGGAKIELLRGADIFVLPSHFEILPVALLEALACGLACIATAVGSVPEVLGDETGLLIPAQNSHALADALRELVRNDALRTRLRFAGRQRAIESYSRSHFVSNLIAIYDQLSTSAAN